VVEKDLELYLLMILKQVNLIGVGLSAFAFYQYDQSLKSQILVRQRAIEMAFTEIHNGPSQTLAVLLRDVQNQDLSHDKLHSRLQYST